MKVFTKFWFSSGRSARGWIPISAPITLPISASRSKLFFDPVAVANAIVLILNQVSPLTSSLSISNIGSCFQTQTLVLVASPTFRTGWFAYFPDLMVC